MDACQQRLAKFPRLLKRFRQAVLAAACSGRLTADWREKSFLSGSHWLPVAESKADLAFEVPANWQVLPLSEITEIRGGIQKTPLRKPAANRFPYLRVANVYRGFLKLDEIEFFELFENELERWALKRDDILIVEGNGSPKEIGRCAIWNEEVANCVHQNHIIRCRPKDGIEAKFIAAFLNSNFGIDEMMQLSSSTSGLHTLSVSKIGKILVPLAPLAEQEEIVRRVEAFFRLADQLEARYHKARAYVDKLTQSLLAKA
ncbi:MAG: restriction endonuclease subunit S, partial [Blastocatellia bacterium]